MKKFLTFGGIGILMAIGLSGCGLFGQQQPPATTDSTIEEALEEAEEALIRTEEIMEEEGFGVETDIGTQTGNLYENSKYGFTLTLTPEWGTVEDSAITSPIWDVIAVSSVDDFERNLAIVAVESDKKGDSLIQVAPFEYLDENSDYAFYYEIIDPADADELESERVKIYSTLKAK